MRNVRAFPRRRLCHAGILLAAFVLAGCGLGEGAGPVPTPTPSRTPAPTLTPTATLPPTPRATSTPVPTVSPVPPSGSVVTRLQVDCRLGAYGLVVRVRYGSTIQDTDSPEAAITRVRVYMDGVLGVDSGPISDRIYAREAAFKGLSRRVHTVQLRIDTRGAPKPADFIQFTQCPPEPDTPLARGVS